MFEAFIRNIVYRRVIICGLILSVFGLAQSATGAAIPDPLRPHDFTPAEPIVTEIEPEEMPTWAVQTIVVSAGREFAVINGRAVKVGQSVDRAKVVAIGLYSVTLNYRGTLVDLKLAKSQVVEPVISSGEEK